MQNLELWKSPSTQLKLWTKISPTKTNKISFSQIIPSDIKLTTKLNFKLSTPAPPPPILCAGCVNAISHPSITSINETTKSKNISITLTKTSNTILPPKHSTEIMNIKRITPSIQMENKTTSTILQALLPFTNTALNNLWVLFVTALA